MFTCVGLRHAIHLNGCFQQRGEGCQSYVGDATVSEGAISVLDLTTNHWSAVLFETKIKFWCHHGFVATQDKASPYGYVFTCTRQYTFTCYATPQVHSAKGLAKKDFFSKSIQRTHSDTPCQLFLPQNYQIRSLKSVWMVADNAIVRK